MLEKKKSEELQNQKHKKKKKYKKGKTSDTLVFEYGDFVYDLLSVRYLNRNKNFGARRLYEEMALRAMEEHYAFYGQLNDVDRVEGYVTRNAVIHCDCGDHNIRIDTYEDHGVIAANGEPVLTCNDCKQDINIYRFGRCTAEKLYTKGTPVRPSGDKEMNAEGKWCYKCMPRLAEKWKQKDSDLYIGDVGDEEFAAALKAEAYLTCQYGGQIWILEGAEKQNTQAKEEMRWIPSQIMQLNGKSKQENSLTKRFNKINDKIEVRKTKDKDNAEKYNELLWNQEKINIVWNKCVDFYYDYGVQVDPRMLLAIIAQEGTGSFDTSGENKAADGGNGVHFDFEADCENAVSLLGGKIIAYLRFHNDFSAARQEGYEKGYLGLQDKSTDDILHYINWKTPRLFLFKKIFESGGYAVDSRWHRKIRAIYSEFVSADTAKDTQEYTDYILTLDANIFERTAEKEGIDINKTVRFESVKNGADENADPTGEYTITGIIEN